MPPTDIQEYAITEDEDMIVALLTILGSLIMLDKYAFGEFGISQPLITGTIIGGICGDIYTGIYLGAMFQLIFLGGLPIGRDIPPDGQTAGIIGTGSYFLLRNLNADGHALFVAVLIALLAAIIGGAFDVFARRFNERLYHCYMQGTRSLYLCHLSGLATAFIRSLCLLLPVFVVMHSLMIPKVFPQLSRDLVLIGALSIGIAHALFLFIKKSKVVYVIIGGICGLVLLVF
jgi:mannose/fructose/N-acetylgalactosamine-specific phosphotransferase system component IIC